MWKRRTAASQCECMTPPSVHIALDEEERCRNDATHEWVWAAVGVGIAICADHLLLRQAHADAAEVLRDAYTVMKIT